MKKINFLIILSVLALGVFYSCSLDEDPVSEATPNTIFNTPSGIVDGVNGVYSYLRDLYGSQPGFTLTTFGTDLFRHGKDGGYKGMDRYSSELNSSMGYLEDIWSTCYAGINASNTILDRIDNVDMDEALKTTYKAEVRFLRAHYYYWLTIQYGDVVYRDTETEGVNTEDVRTDRISIWEKMKEDTEYAVNNLDYTQDEYGRVTKGATLQQLALIDLLLNDYEGAENAAKMIIQEGPYALLSNYADVFDYNNQVNEEIIFAVQYIRDPLFNGDGNQGHLFFTPAYDQYPGLKRDVTQGGRPYTRFRPTEFFRNLFSENDSRFDVTFRYTWFYNNEATLPEGKAIGDTVVWQVESDVPSKIAPNIDKMHWGIKKHDDPTRASFQDRAGFRDFFVYRLSETYLLAAEALLKQDKKQEVADYLNEVRIRASKEGTMIPLVTASQIDMDKILDERALELGAEEKRWMDLARTGKLIERTRLYNPNAEPNIMDYHKLRPIPQSQIDLSTVEFPQNDGY
ncbi:RagB/SusD family nutrient uptake outer membrane protein [Flavobacterium sp. CS20]|uniref:RagB/SusD family nutrient uptake outer membrane protein n=1 Tax=Flavobacterium sp. CS20 TaxID=2775246 RepID=UPI001B39E266|nr:RagB/SusD family nutrient uptake outer membrane protein [Flavobacterium sp. CS20]QTY27926.1 RagB/SusD family nutrient uptake outer membrane protein [Flavobacterium sp. CS20]